MTTIIESCQKQAAHMVKLCKWVRTVCEDYDDDKDMPKEGEEEIENVMKHLGYENFKWFQEEITQSLVARDIKTGNLVIWFRETNEFWDWVSNFRFFLRKAESGAGKVHTGFTDSLDHVYSKIRPYVKQIYSGNGITCVGHSRGGALATLMANRLANSGEGYAPIEIYTFGSPRVGNKKFVNALDQKSVTHYRFVNNNDKVPRVPYRWLGYSDHGNFHYIDYDGNIHTTKSWWQIVKDQFRGRMRALKKLKLFDKYYDHALKRYRRKIFTFCKAKSRAKS